MSSFKKSNEFYKNILNKFVSRQTNFDFKKCSNCNRRLNKYKYIKKKCFCCAFNWREYTLLNTYYNNEESYTNDFKRDLAFHLDILENYKFGSMEKVKTNTSVGTISTYTGNNLFGERYKGLRIIDNLNFEKRYLYRYKNELREKTSKMFWAIFSLNKLYNCGHRYYLPTELIIEIIYNTMYWIPKINY